MLPPRPVSGCQPDFTEQSQKEKCIVSFRKPVGAGSHAHPTRPRELAISRLQPAPFPGFPVSIASAAHCLSRKPGRHPSPFLSSHFQPGIKRHQLYFLYLPQVLTSPASLHPHSFAVSSGSPPPPLQPVTLSLPRDLPIPSPHCSQRDLSDTEIWSVTR